MKVFFASPLHGSPIPAFVDAVADTRVLLGCGWVRHSSPLVGAARNELAAQFLKSDADVMLCADADEKWEAEDARTLVAAARELGIAAAPYPYKTRDWRLIGAAARAGCPDNELQHQGLQFSFQLRPEDCSASGYVGPRRVVDDVEFVRALWVGTGLLAVARPTLERLWAANRYWGNRANVFPTGPDGSHETGEDIGFCRLAAKAGLDVWLAHSMLVEHWGLEAFVGPVALDSAAVDVNLLFGKDAT